MTTRKPTVELLDGNGTESLAHLSIADQIKADANRIEYEMDAAGRRIGVKKLTFRGMHELTLLLGSNSVNAAALQQYMMAGSVVEIDGELVPRPKTELQMLALMDRLDFHGVIAATNAMNRFASIAVDETAVKN